ncbi:histidine kinase [Streptomyces sp. NPDC052052]|uniref:sensor histidine kinase n=1 Tax=Streptomyces sp. NPDC052052 TaxID=3154756 RepID=UPI00344139CC
MAPAWTMLWGPDGPNGGNAATGGATTRFAPPTWKSMTPWLLMLLGPAYDIAVGRSGPGWLATAGLTAFATLYVLTLRASLGPGGDAPAGWRSPWPYRMLAFLAALAFVMAGVWGGNSPMLFTLVALAAGTMLRRRALLCVVLLLGAGGGVLGAAHGASVGAALSYAYSPLLAGLITAAIASLFIMVERLHEAQEELARTAVEQERLRFSRDLHDLLGHTLSVIVVKAEAVRRLAPRDLAAALDHAGDIESVGRQALTEVRAAVTAYRSSDLATELDRARSVLAASGVELSVRRSGTAVPPAADPLLSWVVREGVTNVIRHSGAGSCEIAVSGGMDQVRLDMSDDGCGIEAGARTDGRPDGYGRGGNGLRGLAERLAAAGGSLQAGPGRRGFCLTACLPVDAGEPGERTAGAPNGPDGGGTAVPAAPPQSGYEEAAR